MDEKVVYEPVPQSESAQSDSPPSDLENPSLPPPPPLSKESSSSTPSLPPPSYESISQPTKEAERQKRKCKKDKKCSRFCLGCCSCYGIFCFTWSLLVLCLLCFTVGYYASVVDHCINPPVTYEATEYIHFKESHPNLKDLNILISVVSGSIRLETTDSEDLVVKVIRGAGDDATVEEKTSFDIEYNATHLSLIGKTPTTLFDCPTVQIVVQVPFFSTPAYNRWMLQVETGHVHIVDFRGSLSDLQIHLTTGAVQIDSVFANNLEVITNAGAIYWTDQGSLIQGKSRLFTNSGYIKVQGFDSYGPFQIGTNTGVIKLREIQTLGKIEVDGVWGVLHLTNVRSEAGVFIVSDAAFVSIENDWNSCFVSFATEDGSIDLDHLSTEFVETSENGATHLLFSSDSEYTVAYYITTVSGVVSLYEN